MPPEPLRERGTLRWFRRDADRAGGCRAVELRLTEAAVLGSGTIQFFDERRGLAFVVADWDGVVLCIGELDTGALSALPDGARIEFRRYPGERPYADKIEVIEDGR